MRIIDESPRGHAAPAMRQILSYLYSRSYMHSSEFEEFTTANTQRVSALILRIVQKQLDKRADDDVFSCLKYIQYLPTFNQQESAESTALEREQAAYALSWLAQMDQYVERVTAEVRS